MSKKISRKLKKAERALAKASKVAAKAEKKRDAILLREKTRADKKLAKRDAKDAQPASAPRAAVAKRAASKPVTRPAASKPAASKPASRPAFDTTATVADLREAAKANEISGYSKMTKAQLIEALA